MKIEIDLKDIEALKAELNHYKKKIKDANDMISSIDPDLLKKQAHECARGLFEQYMKIVFESVGLESSGGYFNNCTEIDRHIENNFEKYWYSHDKLDIKITASMSDSFKVAFLKIGVITPK